MISSDGMPRFELYGFDFWPADFQGYLQTLAPALKQSHFYWTPDDLWALQSRSALVLELASDSPSFLIYQDYEAAAEVFFVFVSPLRRRNGLGRQMMTWAQHHNANSHLKSWTLQVHEQNLGALAMYEALGYQVQRRLDRYYRDGQAALEMEARGIGLAKS